MSNRIAASTCGPLMERPPRLPGSLTRPAVGVHAAARALEDKGGPLFRGALFRGGLSPSSSGAPLADRPRGVVVIVRSRAD